MSFETECFNCLPVCGRREVSQRATAFVAIPETTWGKCKAALEKGRRILNRVRIRELLPPILTSPPFGLDSGARPMIQEQSPAAA